MAFMVLADFFDCTYPLIDNPKMWSTVAILFWSSHINKSSVTYQESDTREHSLNEIYNYTTPFN
jgi:hypothetical protein